MATSIADDLNRTMNRFSDRIMENPTLARTAIAMNPDLATQRANRRAAIDSRYPAPAMAVNDMEARWSGLTRPGGIAAQSQPAAVQPPAQTLSPIARPAPSDLAPIRGMRGGFVGAETDALADKALQDRAAQSTAAQRNIASMNAAADSMRDVRAARLGISRGVLDRMEGRTDTAAAAADSEAQGRIPAHWNNPFAMPGDSFQDTRGRQAAYGRAIDQAMNGSRREQQGAQAALQGIGGIADQNRAGDETASRERIAGGVRQAGIDRAALDAQSEAARQQFDRQKWQQQFGLDAAKFGLDANKAAFDAKRQSVMDQSALDKSAKASPNDIKAELMRRYLAGGEDSPAALAALQKLFPTNDIASLLGAGAQ